MTTQTTRIWSDQQVLIFNWFKDGEGHLVVRARAGTGKTTTIIEAIGLAPEEKILVCAFSKDIARELVERIKAFNRYGIQALTLHGVGYKFCARNWQGIEVDDHRGERLARQVLGDEAPDEIVKLVTNLASVAKGACPFPTLETLQDLAVEHDLLPSEEWEEEGWTFSRVGTAVMNAMTLACKRDGFVDFDDMVFVPIRNKWARGWWDLVVVDEAQDMNASQLLLARAVCSRGGRIAVVGDDRQAIYGFRGADSGSIDRLKRELNATELGLTVTYRCPKSVVALAAKIVPDYVAAPTAPEGQVTTIGYEKLVEAASEGDFVLSRKNAPLAKTCLKLLKAGKRAKIAGRDTVGKGLIALVKKMKGKSIPHFLERLNTWEKKETERALKNTNEKLAQSRVDFVKDQKATLESLCEGMAGVKELEARISALFTEVKRDDGKASYILCSSVHRSKGLEAERVFVFGETLRNDDIEEKNIHYVAITRAKAHLTWVTDVK